MQFTEEDMHDMEARILSKRDVKCPECRHHKMIIDEDHRSATCPECGFTMAY